MHTDETTLTVSQAADRLNVSETYLKKLLSEGEIPFANGPPQPQIKLADILAYQERRKQQREAALDELVAQAQELNLGY